MRNKSLSRLQSCLVCLFLATATVFFATCDNGNFMEWPSYTVVFLPNGGNGDMENSIRRHGTAQSLAENAFYKEGYSFAGWARAYSSEVAEFTDRQNVTNLARTDGATIRLYAIWRVHSFTVVYDANGGDGTMGDSVFRLNNEEQNLSPNAFSNEPDIFLGWARSPDGLVEFRDGGSVKDLNAEDGEVITLYARWGRGTFTVIFHANEGIGTVPAAQTVNAGSDITIPDGGELFRIGYAFTAWNTRADGTGITFDVGDTYTPTRNVTLYAIWNVAGTFTVTFDANGGDGTTPNPQMVNEGFSITIPCGGGLSKTYHTFGGWATKDDGTGDIFDEGDTFTPTGDITLYARWVIVSFTVTFDANSGSGDVPDPQTVNADSYITIPCDNGLTKSGYTFDGWNTMADGMGESFSEGDTYRPTEDITLYAVWNLVTIFTITFNANGGSGNVPDPQMLDAGSYVTIPSGSGLSKVGYTFGGWNTEADGTGTNYVAGAMFIPTGNVTLYAAWNLAITFTVTFHANSGSGDVPDPQIITAGSSITLPHASDLSRIGFTFAGWNTRADGAGTDLKEGTTYTPIDNITLYARWNLTLVAHLSWLRTTAQNGGEYVIEISGDEDITPAQAALPTGRTDLTIILRGSGVMRYINLSSNGVLFTIGYGVTLVLDNNITLNGRHNYSILFGSSNHLVGISNGGTLIMNKGSKITGNINDGGGHGGGVRVNSGGMFIMNGGEVSGNSTRRIHGSAGSGGGVFNEGTFRMYSGTISGNQAETSNSGGGGGVFNEGTFYMLGGTIFGNNSWGWDGGGGVLNRGTFFISGGTIFGRNATAEFRNIATHIHGSWNRGDAVRNHGKAQHGIFSNGDFISLGDFLYLNEHTIHVASGVLQ